MKTKIFNLIILDESGSMDCVKTQTISGCNETINTVIAAQKRYADTQEHTVSIYAFQSAGERPSRYIMKNVPATEIQPISDADYCPDGLTPLNDAVGATLVDLKSYTSGFPLAIGSVTIITDGYENSSRHYSRAQVASMIDELKAKGWNFNFIGANIDVSSTAASFSIDNSLEFQQNDCGTQIMFEQANEGRMRYYERMDGCMADCCEVAPEEFAKKAVEASKNFFNK